MSGSAKNRRLVFPISKHEDNVIWPCGKHLRDMINGFEEEVAAFERFDIYLNDYKRVKKSNIRFIIEHPMLGWKCESIGDIQKYSTRPPEGLIEPLTLSVYASFTSPSDVGDFLNVVRQIKPPLFKVFFDLHACYELFGFQPNGRYT